MNLFEKDKQISINRWGVFTSYGKNKRWGVSGYHFYVYKNNPTTIFINWCGRITATDLRTLTEVLTHEILHLVIRKVAGQKASSALDVLERSKWVVSSIERSLR